VLEGLPPPCEWEEEAPFMFVVTCRTLTTLLLTMMDGGITTGSCDLASQGKKTGAPHGASARDSMYNPGRLGLLEISVARSGK